MLHRNSGCQEIIIILLTKQEVRSTEVRGRYKIQRDPVVSFLIILLLYYSFLSCVTTIILIFLLRSHSRPLVSPFCLPFLFPFLCHPIYNTYKIVTLNWLMSSPDWVVSFVPCFYYECHILSKIMMIFISYSAFVHVPFELFFFLVFVFFFSLFLVIIFKKMNK